MPLARRQRLAQALRHVANLCGPPARLLSRPRSTTIARLTDLARFPGLDRCESGLDMAARISCRQDRRDLTVGCNHVRCSTGNDAAAFSPDQDVIGFYNISLGI